MMSIFIQNEYIIIKRNGKKTFTKRSKVIRQRVHVPRRLAYGQVANA